MFKDAIRISGTGSSQTVCQMPGVGGVHDPARLEHLLAARLAARVGRVPDRDDQLLLSARGDRLGDVEVNGS